jgi:hypothetical protein
MREVRLLVSLRPDSATINLQYFRLGTGKLHILADSEPACLRCSAFFDDERAAFVLDAKQGLPDRTGLEEVL